MSVFNFNDKVVVITGGGRGLGKGMAEAFAKCGAKVVMIGIDEENGKKVEKELSAYGTVCFMRADVTNEADVAALPDRIEKQYGPTDILVNNAGILAVGNIVEMPMDVWDKVMDVNVRGVILITKALIPQMLEKQSGVIVNVSSEAGIAAFKNQIAYNVSKAALLHITKCLAVDFADQGVRANVVCPGTTYTPMVEKALKESATPEKLEAMWRDRPIGRLGEVSEIVTATLCLASDEMGYATGAVLTVDGGRVIR